MSVDSFMTLNSCSICGCVYWYISCSESMIHKSVAMRVVVPPAGVGDICTSDWILGYMSIRVRWWRIRIWQCVWCRLAGWVIGKQEHS